MVKWKRELLLSLFLIAFSLVNFIYCGTMKTDIIKVPAAKPDVYLRLWLGILLALSVVLLYRALKNRPQEVLPKLWGPLQIFTIAVFAVYLLAVPYVGFLVATLAFMMIVTTVYNLYVLEDIPKGMALVKHLAVYAVFSVVCTAATEFVFRQLLSVNLPVWKLF